MCSNCLGSLYLTLAGLIPSNNLLQQLHFILYCADRDEHVLRANHSPVHAMCANVLVARELLVQQPVDLFC